MKALVIYDSVFGNTEQIARAIGKVVTTQDETGVVKVGDAQVDQLRGLDLLIVGSPTRGFRPTESIKNYLKSIPMDGLQGIRVAAFDTRISLSDVNSSILRLMVNFFGYAAKPIADSLIKKGGKLAISPEGFIVKGTEGPLKEGELERATDWARQIQIGL